MRELLKKVYEFIAAPIYVRLSRDLTVKTQAVLASNLESQEQMVLKLLDEITRLNLEVERLKNNSDKGLISPAIGLSEEEMERIINSTGSHLHLVQLATAHQIPLHELFEWKSRYGGMSLPVMKRVRRIEEENERLRLANQSLAAINNYETIYSESASEPTARIQRKKQHATDVSVL